MDYSEFKCKWVRDAKGMKDRVTVLPGSLKPSLREYLERVNLVHQSDMAKGYGRVYLPYGLERKYPNASIEWGWQYVFPAKGLSKDPRTGEVRRHHIHENSLQKAVRTAVRLIGYNQTCQCPHLSPFVCDAPVGGEL